MTNREFDQWLRESLSSVEPGSGPVDWDDFVKRVEDEETGADAGFDEAVRRAVAPAGMDATPDWTRMEEMIEADEIAFDEKVKDTIEHYKAPYNPSTWPVLDAKITAEEQTRRRLVAAKIIEMMAILFALFTIYNFYPAIRTNVIEPAEDLIRKEFNKSQAPVAEAEVEQVGDQTHSTRSEILLHPGETPEARLEDTRTADGGITSGSVTRTSANPAISSPVTSLRAPVEPSPLLKDIPGISANALSSTEFIHDNAEALASVIHEEKASSVFLRSGIPAVDQTGTDLLANAAAVITPEILKPAKVRFGMSAAADVNTLYIPEEHFYSQGRSIRFSEKEIVAGGYTAGASLLFDSRKLLFETGLSYSSKNFGPDRTLFIGSSTDQHQVDFENITLNVISVPVNLHWKIDGQGQWRVYAISGASMHVIANAHYDLIAENIYTASAAPQDPMQLQNEREVQRVREHMLDGAKFSTKGYLTAVGGVGIERFLNSTTSVFVQPMYQYQIPFFGLIDQNGKHLQNGTVTIGTRIGL